MLKLYDLTYQHTHKLFHSGNFPVQPSQGPDNTEIWDRVYKSNHRREVELFANEESPCRGAIVLISEIEYVSHGIFLT